MMQNRSQGIQHTTSHAHKNLLVSVKSRAAQLLFAHRKQYQLNLHGKTVMFSTTDPVAHRWFYPRYAFNRIHEKPMTLQLVDDLSRATCFVDVGANLGYYTCLASQFMHRGIIYSFEMDADNYTMLERNVSLNGSQNTVELYNYAVSDTNGCVHYYRLPDVYHPELSIHKPRQHAEQVQVEVPSIALDSFFKNRRVKPDVVKIDVEGAELDVLRGMTGLLPSIWKLYLEIHPENLREAGQTPAEILTLLGQYFTTYIIPDHRTQSLRELIPIQPDIELTGNTIIVATK
jgi:FkbM family methyltransferase